MANEYIMKSDLLNLLNVRKNDWKQLKGKEQDVFHENFVDDIILSIEWIISDVERMKIAE